jgi:hypothetical protein
LLVRGERFETINSSAGFLRRLRIARITPKELMDKLTAGENISIVDLRQLMDIEAFPRMIPGALRIAMEDHRGTFETDRYLRARHRPPLNISCS